MKKKLLIAALMWTSAAYGVTPVATCGEMTGYSYIPDFPEYAKDEKSLKQKFAEKIADDKLPTNWVTDGFKNGTINVVNTGNGKFDILIYNKPRNETFSTIKDGGKVHFMRGSHEELVFLIAYPQTITIYTIVKTNKGNKISVVESKNGIVMRTSMFSGSCTFVDFNRFK